ARPARRHPVAGPPAHPPDLRVAERAGSASRTEAGLIQTLVGDPVPHDRREALIQEQRLEGRPAMPHELAKAGGNRQGAKRVEAPEADGGPVGGGLAKADATQPPRVREHELAAVVEHQMELSEAGRPRVIGPLPARLELDARPTRRGVEASRHPEVETRPRAAVELEPEMLTVAAHPSHTAAREGATEARRRHPP